MMNEDQENTNREKGMSFLKAFFLHPHEALTILGKDRYKSLKIRLFFLIGALAGVPLLLVILVGAFWLRNILDEDFRNQLRWQIGNTQQSIEFFLKEKLSGLRYLTSVYTYDQLSSQTSLNEIFIKRKKEFGELVDLGLIDSHGIQRAYAGPYNLQGRDYSGQDWFHEVVIRGVYVSDVFMGYRKIPHFTIALREDAISKGGFWIMRATIDMETLTKFLSAIKLEKDDDAFIINKEGILQTPSRFHGNLLERYQLGVTPPKQGISLMNIQSHGSPATLGYGDIKDSPWILAAVIKTPAYSRIAEIIRKELAAVYLICALILIGIVMNYRTVKTVVHWIEEADKKREEAISQTEHSAKLASIGRLAAGVAHEINNPLAIINEKAGLMKDYLQIETDSSCRERFLPLLTAITDSINRCRTITHRLLGFARRMDVKIEEIDLNDLIQEVAGFLEREILYRNIRLELNLFEHLPLIESDRGQLQQVFLNIINNAIDAVSEGGLIIVSTVPEEESKFVRVIVRDNGQGIPREALKHIFEPFYTTKEKGKGTGLGLSLSYGIIQRLGGTVQVDSEVNKGTTFIVKLPVKAEIGGGS